jgi:hypothetical protein
VILYGEEFEFLPIKEIKLRHVFSFAAIPYGLRRGIEPPRAFSILTTCSIGQEKFDQIRRHKYD